MDPLAEYNARRERFQVEEKLFERLFIRIGNWRLAVAVVAAALAWLAFARGTITPWSLLIPLAGFIGLVIWHQRVTRKRTLASRAIAYYDRGLARLRDDWSGRGVSGDRYRSPSHIYSEDLDLFGKGSLFELLTMARTAAGEDTLASWLLAPAGHDEVLLRQSAVNELRPNVQLREDTALLSHDVRSDINAESLSAWGSAPIVKFPQLLRPLAGLLAVCSAAAVILVFVKVIPVWPLGLAFGCNLALIFALRQRVKTVLDNVNSSGRDLKIFSALLERLEGEQFHSPKLQKLSESLEVAGDLASKRIARLSRLVDWLDSGDHTLMRVIRPLLLWPEQLAISFEKWRSDSGGHIGTWIRGLAEFEALSSFAALAFERPDWVMPHVYESRQADFEAYGLKHPLISGGECVPNDLILNRLRRLLIVSGSNMSGKSTLLRAVGLNSVLAWAGAPVAADALKLTPVQVGASIRVVDSLQDHRSRFLTEITRIRQIVDRTKEGPPVLFLLDELLSGTNSHDRRIGAAGILRELLRSDAIGLITTHDLALAHIEQDVKSGVANVHFEDHMNGREMLFDYKLKPGVVTHSNAIELMRAVGLNV